MYHGAVSLRSFDVFPVRVLSSLHVLLGLKLAYFYL